MEELTRLLTLGVDKCYETEMENRFACSIASAFLDDPYHFNQL